MNTYCLTMEQVEDIIMAYLHENYKIPLTPDQYWTINWAETVFEEELLTGDTDEVLVTFTLGKDH